MPEAKLANLLKKKCNVLTWQQIVDRQRELYEMYLARDARLDDVDYMALQMVTAIVDEYTEYCQWEDNSLEMMFEAVDLFHFALEGVIAARPDEPVSIIERTSALLSSSVTPSAVLNWSHMTLGGIGWKHWKNPPKDSKIRRNFLQAQFGIALVMSISMFRDAYVARWQESGKNTSEISPEMLLYAFRRCYTLKAEENVKRQKDGY